MDRGVFRRHRFWIAAMSSPSFEQKSEPVAFWQAFLKEEAAWQPLALRKKFEAMDVFVKQHYPKLAFELFDLKDREGVTGLCITAHGDVEQFPSLMDLVHVAPPLAHYEVHAFRSRFKDRAGFKMGMAGFELTPSDVLIGYYAAGQQVGMEIHFASEIPAQYKDHARQMAFIMLDHFIGEYDFAVKVGPVKFVEAWSDAIQAPAPLDQFPPLFDRFWTQELGHTGVFPSWNNQEWRGLEAIQKSDSALAGGPEEKSLIIVNVSAKTVAMRADLSLAMTLTLSGSDKAELNFAQKKQDQIGEILEHKQIGILALTVLKKGRRHAVYYVSDRDAVQRLIDQMIDSNAFELEAEHDFKWSKYRYFADISPEEPREE
jgi:hypothetical protein